MYGKVKTGVPVALPRLLLVMTLLATLPMVRSQMVCPMFCACVSVSVAQLSLRSDSRRPRG